MARRMGQRLETVRGKTCELVIISCEELLVTAPGLHSSTSTPIRDRRLFVLFFSRGTSSVAMWNGDEAIYSHAE
jgi:hypothetical protein